MSFLGGGAECGPSNPLATLGKRLGQDNGLQRDRYGPAAPGPSGANAAMRTQQQQSAEAQRATFQHSFRSGVPVSAATALATAGTPPAWAQDFLKTGLQQH
ncbi:hypothetical protein V8E36_004151 [Tilletia maclaganii]